MPEYITKEAVKQAMRSQLRGVLFTEWELDQVPTVDAVEVVHGRWELYPSSMYRRCSVCKMEYDRPKFNVRANYCPNCGAKMDVEVSTNEEDHN